MPLAPHGFLARHSLALLAAALLANPSLIAAEPVVATPPATQLGTPHKFLAGDYSKHRVALVDSDNKVLWEQHVGAIHDAQFLPEGHILFQPDFQKVVEVDATGKVVWQYDGKAANPGKPIEIHAFQRLANGDTMIAESGTKRIIEVDKAGKITHEVPLKVDHPDTHRDTRLARKLDNGHYLVCHEKDQAVREYDATGKVVWEYGVGSAVYGAERLVSGNTLIGAGSGHKVLEVDPAGKTVWSVNEKEIPGVTLAWVTMVKRLDDGNTLIVNCHCAKDQPQALIVSPDKKLVWSFHDFNRFGDALPVFLLAPVTDK